MPQMSPIMWMMMFFMFITIFMFFNVLNYFSLMSFKIKKASNNKENNIVKNFLTWSW